MGETNPISQSNTIIFIETTWAKSGWWVSHYTHDRGGRYTELQWPLTVETINDPISFQPLSPFNLLTMKSKVVSLPPGKFLKPDVYSKRHWRHTQHIANEFWSRWRKEYLQSLQERQKWTSKRGNFRVDDIVLLKQSDVPWNQWSLGRVIDINNDQKGLVRSVTLKIDERTGNENSKCKLEWPIDKTVLLLESDNVNWVQFPTEKPS